MNYNDFTTRNSGYVSDSTQQKIKQKTVLIAGCGMGSFTAESLARLGVTHFILVDNDIVEPHNLNRQNFLEKDIGEQKIEALKSRLLAINSDIHVECINEFITEDNAQPIVSMADIIFDTIDFVSLNGLISLHEQCYRQEKPVISTLNAGWGAIAIYIAADKQDKNWFKEIFLADNDGSEALEYQYYFAKIIDRIASKLPEEVTNNLVHTIQQMMEGKPCPASQLSAGSFAAASLAATLFHRVMNEDPVVSIPYTIAVDMNAATQQPGFSLIGK